MRLRGNRLLLGETKASRRAGGEQIADVLFRVAAFVDDYRAEVVQVELATMAMLVGGGMEVREAAVTVSDAFERSMESSLRPTGD